MSRALDDAFARAASRSYDVELVDLAGVQIEYADARPLTERQDDSAAVVGSSLRRTPCCWPARSTALR
jgi:hypothetical protein